MDYDEMLLHKSKELLEAMDSEVENVMPHELADIVKFYSKGAAAAALAAAWIPGAGGTAAALTSAGFIWTMYGKIGAKIGLPFGQNVLKSLASGAATNLAASAVGAIAIATALSFIPGLGSIGASVVMGATSYAVTLASGYLYLKILTKLFSKGVDLTTVSEKELKDMANSVAEDNDVQEVLKKAKANFRNSSS
ncbi:MAG: hypothetical protein QX196_10240 [Methylococcaceae bacterium]